MTTTHPLLIDLTAREDRRAETVLTDDFFAGLDQQEILGGELRAIIATHPCAGLQQVELSLEGRVRTLCDRCLSPVELPVAATGRCSIGYEDDEAGDEDTLRVAARETVYDLGWQIYETALLALPVARCHARGDCDPDVAGRIQE